MTDFGKLAFIGGGNMAAALIGGLIRRGHARARIAVAEPSDARRAELQAQFGVAAYADAATAAGDADVVVLAVKPQQMRAVAVDLAPRLRGAEVLAISVAAGIPHAALARWLGPSRPLVRTMPNRPALNGCGATGLYAPAEVGAAERARAEAIMSAVGATVWVESESQMDAVTALSGSGPAYFFLFMEALEAAARELGLPPAIAHRLTVETAYGAARMARDADEPLAALREQVTSKGGTTAAALEAFAAADLGAIVARAVAAASRRSAELAAEYGGP